MKTIKRTLVFLGCLLIFLTFMFGQVQISTLFIFFKLHAEVWGFIIAVIGLLLPTDAMLKKIIAFIKKNMVRNMDKKEGADGLEIEEKSATGKGVKKVYNPYFIATVALVIAVIIFGLAVLIRLFLFLAFLKPNWLDTEIAIIAAAAIVLLYGIAMLVSYIVDKAKNKRKKK